MMENRIYLLIILISSSSNWWWITLIVVVGVAAAGVGGFFLYKKYGRNNVDPLLGWDNMQINIIVINAKRDTFHYHFLINSPHCLEYISHQ